MIGSRRDYRGIGLPISGSPLGLYLRCKARILRLKYHLYFWLALALKRVVRSTVVGRILNPHVRVEVFWPLELRDMKSVPYSDSKGQ